MNNAIIKKCSMCNEDKILNNFPKHSTRCKECVKIKKNEYYAKHKEQKKAYQKDNAEHIRKTKQENYSKNIDIILQKKREYYLINKDKIQKYRKNNKEKISQARNKYYLNNKNDILEKCNVHKLKKYHNDITFKLRLRISTEIRKALTNAKSSKKGHSILSHLQYTILELKLYIENLFEPWMTWENHGKYSPKTWKDDDSSTWTWNIDHIIPQSHLPFTSMEDENFRKCWALENLRPYSAKQNILDGNRR